MNSKRKGKVVVKSRDMKAKAVQYTQEDIQKELSGKLVEFIQYQQTFKNIYLNVNKLKCEAIEMEKQLKGKITMLWQGIPCPKDILTAQYNLTVFEYKSNFINYNNLLDKLKRYNLTEKQIENIINKDEYIKELPGKEDGKDKDKSPDYVG